MKAQTQTYERAPDDELRAAGIDPEWIADGANEDGPYRPYRSEKEPCPCCGHDTVGWTVVNISTATCIGQDWFGDNAECDADEHATMLNGAWRAGFQACNNDH